MATAHSIAATIHGRYLLEPPHRGSPVGLLVGFHGYGEAAEAHLERLRTVPGAPQWLLVSIQGLHRFYNRRSQEVVASWMTRQDREQAIADNLQFVSGVVEAIARETTPISPLVFAGFSQGVAMAFRAACGSLRAVAGVMAVGGDVSPELDRDALGRIPAAFIARGRADEWYSVSKWTADQTRLREAGVNLEAFEFEGGHEWNAEVSAAVGAFLQRLIPGR